MKIYLDIDNTLLITELTRKRPANHLKQFLEYMLKNHDVYWLTTHCNGDAATAVDYLKQFVSKEILSLIKKIKPTTWDMVKSQAINMDEDFLWFDDTLSGADEIALKAKNRTNCFVHVNLKESPDILIDFIEKPAICYGYVVDIFRKSYMLHIWTWPKFKLGWHYKIDGPNKYIFHVEKY